MACQISVLSGSRAGSTFSFDQPTIRLGRDPRCELSFDPNIDLTVSGQHATISFVNGAYQLVDSSTNGTTINGVQIQRGQPVALVEGTMLELGAGGPQIRFSIVGQAAQQATPAAAPPAHASGPQPQAPAAIVSQQAPRLPATGQVSEAAPQAQPATQPSASQTISEVSISIEKPPGGRALEFKQQLVRIGRDPSADIAFDPNRDLLVSFNHAKIVVIDGETTLYDLESTNGTFIGGQQISRRDLRGGEVIEFGRGGPQIRVQLATEQVAAPAVRARGGAAEGPQLGRRGAPGRVPAQASADHRPRR